MRNNIVDGIGRPGPATLILTIACVIAFGAQTMAGANWWDAAPADLLRFGANYAPAVAAGEPWRLISSIFLHGGLLHLLVNLIALLDIGKAVEREHGPAPTVTVFLLAGAAGALVSAARHAEAISIGASGAIFGLFGVWLATAGRANKAQDDLIPIRRRRLALAAYAIVALGSGFLIPGVDNAAHLGGFVAGGALGLSRVADRDAGQRFWAACSVIAAAVLVSAHSLPGDWALPYVEGRRFDRIYHEFAIADRRISLQLQQLGSDSRKGRLSEADALARLDREILPTLRAHQTAWQRERFADASVEREREVWLEYARLRLEAIAALRSAIADNDPRLVARFEARMAAAAALVAAAGQKRGGGAN